MIKIWNWKPYISLEDPDNRRYALEDPRGFLAAYPKGAVLDEVQRTPELFSYLQGILDEHDETGQFILTGSNNFLLQQNITQSLAGRVAYIYLLPFSLRELYTENDTAVLPDEERFIRLMAGRTGQELNMTSLAVDVGVDTKTIQSWIGILESSFNNQYGITVAGWRKLMI